MNTTTTKAYTSYERIVVLIADYSTYYIKLVQVYGAMSIYFYRAAAAPV